MKSKGVFLFAIAVVFLIVNSPILNAHRKVAQASTYITGKVVRGGSNPVRSVWVILFDGDRVKGRSLTGDDGRYYIGNLENKTYTIVVRRQATGGNLASQQVTLPRNRQFDIRVP